MKRPRLAKASISGSQRGENKVFKVAHDLFSPPSELATSVLLDWVNYLETEMNWDINSPLFPRTDLGASTQIGSDQTQRVLAEEHWSGSGPMRKIFQSTFSKVGVEYHNPYIFCDMLATIAFKSCRTPEETKEFAAELEKTGAQYVKVTAY